MKYSKELHDRVEQNLRMFDYPRFDDGDIFALLDEIDRLQNQVTDYLAVNAELVDKYERLQAERKEFCPNCEAEVPCTHEAELYVCDICGEDFAKYIVSRNCNVSDVSMTRDVSIDIKTPSSIANTNPDYYKQEIARLSELLHDEMSQLEIATDLGNKRWLALNDIYENGEKHNANWCKRKAQEGLGIR